MRILMIEDNHSLCEMMGMFFKKEKWSASFAYDGVDGVNQFKADPAKWDVILLDLNLPKEDGMQVGADIRRLSPTVPIIMLTARDSESDQVLGLEMGADDYVTKPFSPITLIARIKALYRRSQMSQMKATTRHQPDFDVVTKHFKLSSKTREVWLFGHQVKGLTPKEFDLLKAMASKPEQVFSRDQLLQLVWGDNYFGEDRTVDAHIKKLRQKMEKAGPKVIQTVWGVGYKFDDEVADKQ